MEDYIFHIFGTVGVADNACGYEWKFLWILYYCNEEGIHKSCKPLVKSCLKQYIELIQYVLENNTLLLITFISYF